MLHVPFWHQNKLLGDNDTFIAAYATFLQSGNIRPSLEEDIHRLEQLSEGSSEDDKSEVCLMHTNIFPSFSL